MYLLLPIGMIVQYLTETWHVDGISLSIYSNSCIEPKDVFYEPESSRHSLGERLDIPLKHLGIEGESMDDSWVQGHVFDKISSEYNWGWIELLHDHEPITNSSIHMKYDIYENLPLMEDGDLRFEWPIWIREQFLAELLTENSANKRGEIARYVSDQAHAEGYSWEEDYHGWLDEFMTTMSNGQWIVEQLEKLGEEYSNYLIELCSNNS